MKRENQIFQANNCTIENFSEDHIDQVYAIELYSNPTPWSEKIFHKIIESRSLSFVIKHIDCFNVEQDIKEVALDSERSTESQIVIPTFMKHHE